MDKRCESWKEFFGKRSAQIYELRYSSKIILEDNKKRRLYKQLDDFLKEKLSEEDYKKADELLNSIYEKNGYITGLWNEKFYFSGVKDGKKYGEIIKK